MEKVTRACVCFLVALFVVCAAGVCIPDEAEAAQSRVTWKLRGSDIVKKEGVMYLRVLLTLYNNSTDERAISRYYDKKIKISGVLNRSEIIGSKHGFMPYDMKYSYTHTSSKVNNIELFPGKSLNTYFDIPLSKVLGKQYYTKSSSGNFFWYKPKSIKVHSFDFKYRTEAI